MQWSFGWILGINKNNHNGLTIRFGMHPGFHCFVGHLSQQKVITGKRRSCFGWLKVINPLVWKKTTRLKRVAPLLSIATREPVFEDNSHTQDKKPTSSQQAASPRSMRLKLLWRDPEFRAKNLAARRANNVLLKQSIAIRERWKNPNFRKKVCDALKGRKAWNKGKRMSKETRMKMSLAAKRRHEKRKSKQQDCELCQVLLHRLQCLYKDLKLWSDNFRSNYTRLPRMSDVEKSCAPMLLLKINRYVELRNILKTTPYCMNFENMVILKEDTEKISE